MQHHRRWMVAGLMVVSAHLTACGQAPSAGASKIEPAEVHAIEGTELNRVVLVAEAAKRLDIKTAAVRDMEVTRKRTVGGEVVAVPGSTTKVRVHVPLSEGDLTKVDRSQAAMILPLARTEAATGVAARPVAAPAGGNSKAASATLYYEVDSAKHSLAAGQRVRVELSLAGSGMQRRVIPYASLIYDLHGDTWVYTSPAPLTFVRELVTVDYIDGDLAVLVKGPSAGTSVVTAGAAELYGTEFGVGH